LISTDDPCTAAYDTSRMFAGIMGSASIQTDAINSSFTTGAILFDTADNANLVTTILGQCFSNGYFSSGYNSPSTTINGVSMWAMSDDTFDIGLAQYNNVIFYSDDYNYPDRTWTDWTNQAGELKNAVDTAAKQ